MPPVAGLLIRIGMDWHSFQLLDPDLYSEYGYGSVGYPEYGSGSELWCQNCTLLVILNWKNVVFMGFFSWAVLRIRDVYPGSWFLPIPDPGSKNGNKRDGWKKNFCQTFFCSHKFHKIVNNFFFFKCWRKKLACFQRIIEPLTQKFFTKL